jgi:serine/threonine-protein kinase
MGSDPPSAEDVDLTSLDDFDDGELERTSVGVNELFGAQEVPQYPAVAKLGQFEILGRIARGGMAEVYLARDRAEDGSVRHVVVKRVLTEMQHDAAMLRMFLDEGAIALRLFHPNVCHVYECGEANGLTFMALEWVHGTSLREVIRRAGPRGGIPVPVAVHVIARIAGALEYVHHAKGVDGRPLSIVHQDVTPHNVMLSWKGQVKLLDFGIAKTSAQAEHGASVPQGKFEYMSPEQVRGEPIDARSDVFALGVCLYEALTARSLYSRESPPQIMTAIVEEPVPSIRSVRPDLPDALDRIVRRALAKRRDERFASAGEMEKALDAWLQKNGHTVADVRVALAVSGLFTPAEKAPLPPGAANLTGTLAAISEREAITAAQESWAERFDHSQEVSHAKPSPVGAAPKTAPRRSGGGVLGTIALFCLLVLLGLAGGVVGIYFFAPQLVPPEVERALRDHGVPDLRRMIIPR